MNDPIDSLGFFFGHGAQCHKKLHEIVGSESFLVGHMWSQ